MAITRRKLVFQTDYKQAISESDNSTVFAMIQSDSGPIHSYYKPKIYMGTYANNAGLSGTIKYTALNIEGVTDEDASGESIRFKINLGREDDTMMKQAFTSDYYYGSPADLNNRGFTININSYNQNYIEEILSSDEIDHITIEGGGDDPVLTFSEGCYITLFIGIEHDALPAPTLSLNVDSVPPNQTIEDALSYTTNQDYEYIEILRKEGNGDWRIVSVAENSSFDLVTSSLTTTIYYKVRGAYLGQRAESNIVSITPTLTTASAPESLAVDLGNENFISSPFYVANPSSSQTYTLKWDPPSSAGSNNTVIGYNIYRSTSSNSKGNKINDSLVTKTSYPITPHLAAGNTYYYYVLPVNSNENAGICTSYSSAYQIATVAKPSPALFSSITANSHIVVNNFSANWEKIATINGATIKYQLQACDLNNNVLYTSEPITEGTGEINIQGISNGTQFKIKLLTLTYGNNEVNTKWVEETVYNTIFIKGSSLTYTDRNITILNDNNQEAALAYNTITLSWSKAESTVENAQISYTIRYQAGLNSQWLDLVTISDTSYKINNFSSIALKGGNTLTFKIVATDNYGASIESSSKQITKMYTPVINNLMIAGTITNTEIPYSFAYTNGNSNDPLECIVKLGYNGKEQSFSLPSTLESQSGTITGEEQFSIEDGQSDSSTQQTMLGALYNKVITNKFPQPNGTLTIILRSTTIPACEISRSINFKYNFYTPIKCGTLTIGEENRNFYNPGDEISYEFESATWSDAAGGVSGGDLKYFIETGGQRIECVPGTVYKDIAPQAVKDITLNYTLYCIVTYADGTIIQANSHTKTINIARWDDSDFPYLSQLKKDEKNRAIEGFLVMPKLFCGSEKYSNFASAYYEIYFSNNTTPEISATLTDRGSLENHFIINNLSDDFDFSKEIGLYAKVKFTNTSEKVFEKETSIYIIRASGVTMALRNGRVGINVDSQNFIVDKKTALKNSALYVAALNGTAPIVELAADDNITSQPLINFIKKDQIWGKIFYDGEHIQFDNLYYPSIFDTEYDYTKKEYNITLENLDSFGILTTNCVKGTGISFDAGKLINTGILDVKISNSNSKKIIVTSIDGDKELTISGFVDNYNGYVFNSLSIEGFTNRPTDNSGPYHAKLSFTTKQEVEGSTMTVEEEVITALYKANYVDDQDVIIRSKTNMVIGTGESADKIYENETLSNKTTKTFCLTSDSNIKFYSDCNSDAPFIYTMENGILTTNELKTTAIETEEINTNLINGKAIRYGENIPTDNLVVGQIWLKPKN